MYTKLSVEETLMKLQVDSQVGLSTEEVKLRQQKYGLNIIED